MNESYDPTKYKETLAERGLFNPSNYVAIIGLGILVYFLDYFTGQGIWHQIAETMMLLPPSLEVIQAWKVGVYLAVALFWQFAIWSIAGEISILALPGSIVSFLVNVFILP